jgi:hypothetical protein
MNLSSERRTLASYQIYFLTRDGEILRMLELDCARDQHVIQKASQIRGTDEVEIEVWERTRFVGWPAVPAFTRTVDPWQKTARLIALIAMSSGLAVLATTLVRWSVEALS